MRDGRNFPNVAFIFCLPGLLESLESLLIEPLRETKEKESFSSLSAPIWVAFIWRGVFCVCVCARLKGWEQSIFNVAVIWRTHKYCIWDVIFFWTKFLNRFACYGSIIGIFIITPLTPSCFKGLMTQNKHFLEFEREALPSPKCELSLLLKLAAFLPQLTLDKDGGSIWLQLSFSWVDGETFLLNTTGRWDADDIQSTKGSGVVLESLEAVMKNDVGFSAVDGWEYTHLHPLSCSYSRKEALAALREASTRRSLCG